MGLLETIRAAVAGPGEFVAPAEDAGAEDTSNRPAGANQEADMADAGTAPGAAVTGISEADHKAAVTKAETDGKAAGRKEANDRMASVIGAEGIKGDGGRMAAALDLAAQSPDMAAEGVAAFVLANVPAAKPAADAAANYDQQRINAAGLTRTEGAGAEPANKAAAIVANYNAVTGNAKRA